MAAMLVERNKKTASMMVDRKMELNSILKLIIDMKKFLHSDWLRAVQFFFKNSAEKS